MLMAMLGMSAAPAFAVPGQFTNTPFFTCTNPDTLSARSFVAPWELSAAKSEGYTDCVISAL
jgi:hypothetical protein